MSKRTLDAFFKASTSPSSSSFKKLKEHNARSSPPITSPTKRDEHNSASPNPNDEKISVENHSSYPFPIARLPSHISVGLEFAKPGRPPRTINDHPHLDLLYFEPYIPQPTAKEYFGFLRQELPFYRVKYTIKRGPTETLISTPRFTTVFGVDITSYFSAEPHKHNNNNRDTEIDRKLLDSKTHQPIASGKYKCTPRPIPACLDLLRRQVEEAQGDGTTYNFVLVNYYASGDDSISYHSDDERFLGPNPNIASVTLGAKRDFLLKHKPYTGGATGVAEKPLKLPLASGDMVIMRGETQSNWLHSIPKRKGGEAGSGRINITLRKAVVPGGTENYYRYNVGDGDIYRWDDAKKEMILSA